MDIYLTYTTQKSTLMTLQHLQYYKNTPLMKRVNIYQYYTIKVFTKKQMK